MPWWVWLALAAAGLMGWRLTRPGPQPEAVAPVEPRYQPHKILSAFTPVEASRACIGDEDDDDGYAGFVKQMWAAAEIPCGRIAIDVNGTACVIHSLTRSEGRPPYVNLVTGNPPQRKTFAADARHRWTIDGLTVSPAIFGAISEGRASPADIRPDDHPTTMAEAQAKDRLETKARRFALQYRDSEGVVAWRVVSRLQRGPEYLYAACHLRWGESRSFRYDRILTLVDIEGGDTIDLQAYIARRMNLPAKRKRRSS